MHLVGGRAWSVSSGGFQDALGHALAVREWLNLPRDEQAMPGSLLPGLAGRLRGADGIDRMQAAEQWKQWWAELLTTTANRHADPEGQLVGDSQASESMSAWLPDGPTFASLLTYPDLRRLAVQTWPEISEWQRRLKYPGSEVPHALRRTNGLALHHVVDRVDRVLGREMADIRLRVDVLPVAETGHWIVTADPESHHAYALASSDWATDFTAHADWVLELLIRIG